MRRSRIDDGLKTPEADYEDGRAAMRQQHHEDEIGGAACPYPFGDKDRTNGRVNWLTGYYDQFVDDSEIRARDTLGLPLVNWVPPAEEGGKKKGKHHVRERN